MRKNSNENAISVQNVNKIFKLPHEKQSSVKGIVLSVFKGRRTYEKQHVLKDISFDIKKGEFFGIVGRNGSGKSTLLKLLAGTYTPDSGNIHINGSLTPFIELGVGFNPELTGRENVYLNGALLGFNRDQMDKMYDDIVKFAELGKFMDQKLKNYSSGMQVRLAFSIAIRANTDILVLDEVLAVGDTNFQKKCYDYFTQLKRARKTVVLVTHDMSAVERFCERVLVLNKGRVEGMFLPSEAATKYDLLNSSSQNIKQKKLIRWGSGKIRIKKILINNQDPSKTENITCKTGAPFDLKIYLNKPTKEKIVVGIGIEDSFGVIVAGPNSIGKEIVAKNASVEFLVKKIPLLAGEYKITLAVYNEDLVKEYDHLEKAYALTVITDKRQQYGKVDLFGEWITE